MASLSLVSNDGIDKITPLLALVAPNLLAPRPIG
jgi:hypothetical protein